MPLNSQRPENRAPAPRTVAATPQPTPAPPGKRRAELERELLGATTKITALTGERQRLIGRAATGGSQADAIAAIDAQIAEHRRFAFLASSGLRWIDRQASSGNAA